MPTGTEDSFPDGEEYPGRLYSIRSEAEILDPLSRGEYLNFGFTVSAQLLCLISLYCYTDEASHQTVIPVVFMPEVTKSSVHPDSPWSLGQHFIVQLWVRQKRTQVKGPEDGPGQLRGHVDHLCLCSAARGSTGAERSGFSLS